MVGTVGAPTRLLHISDSHLGYTPYGSPSRAEDFTSAFEAAVGIACEREVDAVVHTGDVTHDSDTTGELPPPAWRALERLATNDIPFYFLLGNHDLTDEGNPQPWARSLEQSNLGIRLGSTPATVGQIALYGVDYRPSDGWDGFRADFESPGTEMTPLLCLHQSITPVAPGPPNLTLDDILATTPIEFDAVLAGHSHYTQTGQVDDISVYYAGATERTTRGYDGEPTVVSELRVGDGITQQLHNVPTRAFETYTLIPETEDEVTSLADGLFDDAVVTIYYPESHTLDTSAIETQAMAAGALDANAHRVALPSDLQTGLYACSPNELGDSSGGSAIGAPVESESDVSNTLRTDGSQDSSPSAENDGSDPGTREELGRDERGTQESTFLHVGPLEIASANLSVDRREDFQRQLSAVIDIAIEEQVSAVIQSGTFFGTASPPSYSMKACREALERLAAANIPFLHAGSERDRDMEEFDSLIDASLIRRLDAEPTLVDDVAVYGLESGDEMTVVASAETVEVPPPDATQVLVGGTVTVAPPLERTDADVSREQLLAGFPFDIDACLLGGAEDGYVSRGPPDIFDAGPTERKLYQRTFETPPEYPCHVGLYRPQDGSYESVELPYRPVHTYVHDTDPGDTVADVLEQINTELSGATVMVQLRGGCHPDDFEKAALESELEARADIVKVYDKRVVLEHSGTAAPDDESAEPTTKSGDLESDGSESGAESTRSEAESDPAESESTAEGSTEAGQDSVRDDESSPDSTDSNGGESPSDSTTSAGERSDSTSDSRPQPEPSAKSSSDQPPVAFDETALAELPADSGFGHLTEAGSDLDPESHLAGEALEEAGYAEIRSTSEASCGYVFDARRFARETDQRRGVDHRDLDGGEWHCPHPAPDGDRCPFHAPRSETDESLQALFRERIDEADHGATRFIGATFPELTLDYEEINSGTHSLLDFTHAHVAGDIRLSDTRIAPEVRFDGIAVDGKLSVQNCTFERNVKMRGAYIHDGIQAQWSTFGGTLIFADALLPADLRFQNCDFDSVAFSNATYGGDLSVMKSHFQGEVYFYECSIAGLLDSRRADYGSELLFDGAVLCGGADFENATFTDTVEMDGCGVPESISLVDATAEQRVVLADLLATELDCTDCNFRGRLEVLGGVYGTIVANNGVFHDTIRVAGIEADHVAVRTAKLERDVQVVESAIQTDIDLSNTVVDGTVLLVDSPVGQTLSMTDAHLDGGLSLSGELPRIDAEGIRAAGDVRLTTDTDGAGPLLAPGGAFGDRLELSGSGSWRAVRLPNTTFTGAVTVATDIAGEFDAVDTVFNDAAVLQADIDDSLVVDRARFEERLAISEMRVAGRTSVRGGRFERGLTIDDAVLSGLDASSATFSGAVEFGGSSVSGELSVADARFAGTLRLHGGPIGSLDTSDAVFQDTVAVKTDIDGSCVLAGARFDGAASFEGIDIEGPTSLEELRANTIDFTNVVFGADLDASRAAVERRATFSGMTVEGVTSFIRARSNDGASFKEAQFLAGTSFEGMAVAGRADFTDAQFADGPSFVDATLATAIFDGLRSTMAVPLVVDCTGAELGGGRITQSSPGARYDMTDAHLGPIDIDLSRASFEQYRLYRTTFDGFRFSNRKALTAAGWEISQFGEDRATSPAGLETTYRLAKNGASQVGDSDAEGQFFTKEMEARETRHRDAGSTWKARINKLYRLSSGYGEQPMTVIASSAVAVLIFAAFIPIIKGAARLGEGASVKTVGNELLAGTLLPTPYNGVLGWLLLSAESFTTLVHGGTRVVHPWLRGWGVIEGFMGAFFIALFLFTLTKAIDR